MHHHHVFSLHAQQQDLCPALMPDHEKWAPDLLQGSTSLAFHMTSQTLILFRGHVVWESVHLSRGEASFYLQLYTWYPHVVSDAVFAQELHWRDITPSGTSGRALLAHLPEETDGRIQSMIAQLRAKVRRVGIDIRRVVGTGYVLQSYPLPACCADMPLHSQGEP